MTPPSLLLFFFLQAEDGIRDPLVTGVQTCALPISRSSRIRACSTCRCCSRFREWTAKAPTPTRFGSCVSSTRAGLRSNYRWTILGAGVVGQAGASAVGLGLPAIAPAIRHGY